MGHSIFEETMADMTWVEVEKAIQEEAIVLLPTGVIEEHGPHLDLGTDTYTGWLLCKSTRHHLEAQGVKTLVAPPCYWGINQATGGFPGSFTVRQETFKALLLDIYSCLKTWGVKYVFNIDAHGDPAHEHIIFEAAEEAQATIRLSVYALVEDHKVAMAGLTGKESYIVVTETPPLEGPMPQYADIHAGAIETGMMMKFFPDLVKAGVAKELQSTQLTWQDIFRWQQGGKVARGMTPLGYFGAPAEYERDLENVQRYFTALPKMYAETIVKFLDSQEGRDSGA